MTDFNDFDLTTIDSLIVIYQSRLQVVEKEIKSATEPSDDLIKRKEKILKMLNGLQEHIFNR